MRPIRILTLLILTSLRVQAQNGGDNLQVNDGYLSLLEKAKKYASSGDNKQALSHTEVAYEMALASGDSVRIVESGRMRGQLENYLGNHQSAIAILDEVKSIASRNSLREDYNKILINLALAHTYLSRYDKALPIQFDLLSIFEQEKDSVNIGITLNNIGIVYYRLKNFQEALHFYLRAYAIQSREAQTNVSVLLNNIGFCYSYLNDAEKAIMFFEKSLARCSKDCDAGVMFEATLGIGACNFSIGKSAEAKKLFNDAYHKAVEMGSTENQLEALLYITKLHISQNEIAAAKDSLLKIEEKATNEESFVPILITAYQLGAHVYKELRETDKALDYLEKHVALKDKIYNTEMMDNIGQARSAYNERENLATIKAHQITIEHQRKQSASLLIIIVLGVALMGLSMYMIYRGRRFSDKLLMAQDIIYDQNKKLEVKNTELDKAIAKKTEELSLINLSLNQVNYEMNLFISRTSQDIKGPLATLKGICNIAKLDIKDTVSQLYLDKINDTVDNLLGVLKRLILINQINTSKTSQTEIDIRAVLDTVIATFQAKGLPHNLTLRKSVTEVTSIFSDKELLTVVLEHSIENAIKLCRNSPRAEHFVLIDVSVTGNGRVRVSVTNNGVIMNSYTLEEFYNVGDGTTDDLTESASPMSDLYFLKAAAKKIGGKVDVSQTREGYNQLSVVI